MAQGRDVESPNYLKPHEKECAEDGLRHNLDSVVARPGNQLEEVWRQGSKVVLKFLAWVAGRMAML